MTAYVPTPTMKADVIPLAAIVLLLVPPVLSDDSGTNSPSHPDTHWRSFKASHNKTYSPAEERHRRRNWETNLDLIREHNARAADGHHSYVLRDNHLADLSSRQFARQYVRVTHSNRERVRLETPSTPAARKTDPSLLHTIPSSVDWTLAGLLTPVWNQADCGACYAFSVAAIVQAQLFKQTGVLLDLSEQQLLDCSMSYGNFGCLGGSLRSTLRYLEHAGGIMAEVDYPYEGKAGECRFDKDKAILNITGFELLPAKDEVALAVAVATVGPVAASINASPNTFQFYHRGKYDDPTCTSDNLNHAVLIVGYTPTEWIIKNWWSERWGEGGYMRLRRGVNRCGIANFAVYAKIDPVL